MLVQTVPAQGEFTIWSATQIPHILRDDAVADHRDPRGEAARDRAGRRRRLRLEARTSTPRRRSASRSRSGSDAPIKWTEERSEGYLATIHGRDVSRRSSSPRPRTGGSRRCACALTAAMGAYLQLVTPGHPDPRRLALRRRLRHRGLRLRRAPASSRTRRRPTPTAARAGRRRRTRSSGRWTPSPASSARTRSSSGG